MVNIVAVDLTLHDAALFKQFCQYYDKFNFMIESGMFDIKRGYATVNFGNNGEISSIQKSSYIYPSKKLDNVE